MKRMKMALLMVVAVAALGFSACTSDDDASITCNNLDNFLADCTGTCSVTWDCESQYDTLSVDDQIVLDNCSDCLAANTTCADCSYDDGQYQIDSCLAFMDDVLGTNCW